METGSTACSWTCWPRSCADRIWIALGATDEQKQAKPDTVEAWARSEDNEHAVGDEKYAPQAPYLVSPFHTAMNHAPGDRREQPPTEPPELGRTLAPDSPRHTEMPPTHPRSRNCARMPTVDCMSLGQITEFERSGT